MTCASVTAAWGAVFSSAENIVPYSQDFGETTWNLTGSALTEEAAINPVDGRTTATALIEDGTAGNHRIYSDLLDAVTSGTSYTLGVYVKANGRSRFELYFGSSGFASQGGRFDLTAETATVMNSGTVAITELSDGWYLCTVTATASASAQWRPDLYMLNAASAASYTGDGTSGLYIFGLHARRATATNTDYVRTLALPALQSSMTAYTDKFYPYDITQRSEGELDDLYYNQEVNCFTYVVTRIPTVQMTRTYEHQYRVDVSYYRYKDEAGGNQQTMAAAFEDLHDAARAELGNTWAGTVDYWRPGTDPIEFSTVAIGGDECHRARQIFTGFKRVSV